MQKDIEEVMQSYDRFIEIVKQMAMDAKEQTTKLKGTVVADELASDFSEIGMMYAIVKSIDEMLISMSKRNELWTEEALLNAEEWNDCRKKSRLLLQILE